MIENYTYNEVETRFEPQEKKCTYCDVAHVAQIETCYFVPLFLTKDTTNLIVYRSVKFAKILIGIPRCKECSEIHAKSKTKAILLSWSIALGLIFFLFYNLIYFGGIFVAIAALSSMFIGICGTNYFTNRFAANHGIYALQDGAESNAVVQEMVISGWSLTKPAP